MHCMLSYLVEIDVGWLAAVENGSMLFQPVLIVRRPALCVIDTVTGHVEFSPDPSQHATFLQSVLRYEQYYASIL